MHPGVQTDEEQLCICSKSVLQLVPRWGVSAKWGKKSGSIH